VVVSQTQTAKVIIAKYSRWYEVLGPSIASVQKTSALWDAWEREDLARPDTEKISSNAKTMEEEFFKELSDIASELSCQDLVTHYCPFRTSRYNFSAFTAKDGYIVLVDEAFFQFLFILVVVLFHSTYGEISSQTLKEMKEELKDILLTCYFGRQSYDFDDSNVFHRVIESSYELTEMANYFFQAIKSFILGHELGHHALGHTKGYLTQRFAIANQEIELSVDKREWQDEYQADHFGYQVYLAASSPDSTAEHTAFKYKIDFAPIFFFDICQLLEELNDEGKEVVPPDLMSHPPLALRKKKLIDSFGAFSDSADIDMYEGLLESLDKLLPTNALKE